MELSEKTRLSLPLWNALGVGISLITSTVIVLMFFGIIPTSNGQVVSDCDTVKLCGDEKYITKEKLNDSLRLFEKDIEFLKRGEIDQKKVNENTERSLEKITDLLIKINRNNPE